MNGEVAGLGVALETGDSDRLGSHFAGEAAMEVDGAVLQGCQGKVASLRWGLMITGVSETGLSSGDRGR